MVGQEEQVNLPWVEKYRPESLADVVSHTEIIKTLTKFIEANKLPHLLFYGPPGTGKTTAILAAARSMYSDKQKTSMVLELNASDDRGIGVVREDIITFAQTKSLHVVSDARSKLKLVILDEADAMTKDAQNALRRCTRFRFQPLNLDLVLPRIEYVANNEKVNITADGKKALLDLSGGDMRRVLNVLQAVSMAFDEVNETTVYQCVGQPTPKEMQTILKTLLNDSLADCCEKLEKDCLANGFALADIVTRLHDLIFQLDVPDKVTMHLIAGLANCEKRVAGGSSERIQTAGLVSTFIQARRLIAQAAHSAN